MGRFLVRRFWLAPFALLALGCGAAPRAVEAPPPAPAPPPEPAPPSPAATAPTARVACKARVHSCAEYDGIPATDATTLRQKCAAEGGEVLDACPANKVVGTCTAARPTMTVRQHVYRAKTGRETRGLVFDSRRACESKGGTFTAGAAS